MKKLLSILISAAMITAPLYAAADDITVTLDGSGLEFDVPPQIIDDFTFVPMRAIFEALGAGVSWDGGTQTVTADKDGTEIIMNIGYNMMFVNYSPVTLEAPPVIIDGRTLVPVRAVAESFGCVVEWNSKERRVIINSAAKDSAGSGEVSAELPIEYDAAPEASSHSAGGFRLTEASKNSDGKYEIKYTLQTYQDSSGKQMVLFDCLDAEGKKIDSFGGYFYNDAYNWTQHEGSAVISGKTVKIRLSENNQ